MGHRTSAGSETGEAPVARRLVQVLGALTLLVTVLSLVRWFWWQAAGHVDPDFTAGIAFAVLAIACAVTGTLVTSRVPRNSVGWIILLQGLGMSLALACGVLSASGPRPGLPIEVYAVAGWFSDLLVSVALVVPPGLLLLVFPTGRLLSRAWWIVACFFVIAVLTAATGQWLLVDDVGHGLGNPFAPSESDVATVQRITDIAGLAVLPAVAACMLALFQRLRSTRGTERQRVKWIAYTSTLAVAGFAIALFADGPWADLAWTLALLGVVLLPVTMGVAILRHRLFDIDLVIKRTLVYSSLTVALVAAYLLSVLLLQVVLRGVTGDSDLAVAVSTLAVAALFRPLRAAIQGIVDRRFFRSRYDAARTLDEYSERLRHELDLAALRSDLQTVVQETMQPAHVSLWLRGGR